MAAVFAFLGMLLISMLVALLAALQLGDFFNANDEFGLVILGVVGFHDPGAGGVRARLSRWRGGPAC